MTQFKPGQSGNPSGRPRGLSDRRTLFRQMIDPYQGKLVNVAVEMALNGNEQMLRLLLNRLLPAKPRDDTQIPDINLTTAQTYRDRCNLFDQALCTGNITLNMYKTLSEISTKRFEQLELEERITTLEKKINEKTTSKQ